MKDDDKQQSYFPDGFLHIETGHIGNDWVEGAMHIDAKTGRLDPLPSTRAHIVTSINRRSIQILLGLFGCVFFIVLARLMYVQLFASGSFQTAALRNSQRVVPIPSERGVILDANGVALTQNVPKFSLALVPQDLPRDVEERKQIVSRLAALTQKPEDEIEATLKEYGSYRYESVVIEEDIPYETALSLYVSLSDLPGISIIRGSKRQYVQTFAEVSPTQRVEGLSHVLGYLGKLSKDELDVLYKTGYLPSDDIGKTGLEKTYESQLRGTYGRRLVEVNALGRVQRVLSESSPVAGQYMTLAMDIRVQAALERALKAHLTAEYPKATAIVSDVNTGEILAYVSTPSYNNNDFSGGITTASYTAYLADERNPFINRGVSGNYPSGSTLKPFVALIGLGLGTITAETTVNSTGGLAVGRWFFPDWQGGGHGITNVTKALAQSVNTFFYYLVGGYGDREGMGVDALMAGLKSFGFSEKMGIDIPGESDGFLPSKEWKEKTKGEPWYIGDTYNVSIGQGDVLVTPLQINVLTAAIANGGTVYQPRFVRAFSDKETGERVSVSSTVVRELPANPYHISVIGQGMRECAVSGSCRRLSLLPFTAAGKTGTAQWNANKNNHAWFTGYAPYENPQIAITVLVEEGKEGSAVAVPIAYDFLREWGKIRNESQ